MDIELLYFDGCPSWQTGLARLRQALDAEGIGAEMRLVNVADDEMASALRFLGSPSFRVNGADLWPEAREQYALGCRVYATPQGLRGVPAVDQLRERLQAAAASTAGRSSS